MKNSSCALLVFACDRYELLFGAFEYTFRKNWDFSFDCKLYFSTEEIDISLKDFIHLKSGKGEWTNRLKRVLDQIPEKYIIFFQEDMWMNKHIGKGIISGIFDYVITNDLKLVKLHSSEYYRSFPVAVEFDGLVLSEIKKNKSDFLMSHQVSVWNKDFLYDQLKDNEDPWKNEKEGTKRLKRLHEKICQVDLLCVNGKPPLNENKSLSGRGEYYTVSKNAILQEESRPFIEGLKDVFPDYYKKLIYNLNNKITHDGNIKPRKITLKDRIKRRWRRVFR